MPTFVVYTEAGHAMPGQSRGSDRCRDRRRCPVRSISLSIHLETAQLGADTHTAAADSAAVIQFDYNATNVPSIHNQLHRYAELLVDFAVCI